MPRRRPGGAAITKVSILPQYRPEFLTGLLAAIVLAPALACGQTIDRVVACVGNSAITATDVQREYRLELFLEGRNPAGADADVQTLNQVRDRLINRMLLEDEVQADGIEVSPDDQAVTEQFEALRRRFPSKEAFVDGLRTLGLDEQNLRQDLARQQEILQLIDQRLRPLATVQPSEIEAYYRDTLLPELACQGEKPPALDEVQDRIREILVQQKIDPLLTDWLAKVRARHEVRVFGSAEAANKP